MNARITEASNTPEGDVEFFVRTMQGDLEQIHEGGFPQPSPLAAAPPPPPSREIPSIPPVAPRTVSSHREKVKASEKIAEPFFSDMDDTHLIRSSVPPTMPVVTGTFDLLAFLAGEIPAPSVQPVTRPTSPASPASPSLSEAMAGRELAGGRASNIKPVTTLKPVATQTPNLPPSSLPSPQPPPTPLTPAPPLSLLSTSPPSPSPPPAPTALKPILPSAPTPFFKTLSPTSPPPPPPIPVIPKPPLKTSDIPQLATSAPKLLPIRPAAPLKAQSPFARSLPPPYSAPQPSQTGHQPLPRPIQPHPTAEPPTGQEVLRPEELLALDEETIDISNTTKGSLFKKLLLGIVLLALLGGGGFAAYFLFLKKDSDAPAPLPPPAETPTLEHSGPALSISHTLAIEAPSMDEARVELQELLATSTVGGETRLLSVVLKSDPEQRALNLNEILSLLDITVPASVLSALEVEKFSFLLEYETDGSPRVALAVAIKNDEAIIQEMADWEALLPSELDGLMQSLGKTQNPESLAFRNGTQSGGIRRFLNYPEPNLSIDYVVHRDTRVLLLATSQRSLNEALAALPTP